MLIEGHFDGETWGCCAIVDEGCEMFVSSGDDNTILLYDLAKKRVVGRGTVEVAISPKSKGKGKKKLVKGKAASQSRYPAR